VRAETGDGLLEGVDACGVGVEGEVIENALTAMSRSEPQA